MSVEQTVYKNTSRHRASLRKLSPEFLARTNVSPWRLLSAPRTRRCAGKLLPGLSRTPGLLQTAHRRGFHNLHRCERLVGQHGDVIVPGILRSLTRQSCDSFFFFNCNRLELTRRVRFLFYNLEDTKWLRVPRHVR